MNHPGRFDLLLRKAQESRSEEKRNERERKIERGIYIASHRIAPTFSEDTQTRPLSIFSSSSHTEYKVVEKKTHAC